MSDEDIAKNRNELVSKLIEEKGKIYEWFESNCTDDLNRIVEDSIGRNTIVAIRGATHPLDAFREWANGQLNNEINEIIQRLNSKVEYDTLLEKVNQSLAKFWRDRFGDHNELLYCHKRKLTDLLFKRLALWTGLGDGRKKLIPWLNVPLDKFVFAGIRDCLYRREYADSIGQIPKPASISFVRNKEMYNALQVVIGNIAGEAGVPAIYVDILKWDFEHL